MTHNEMGAISLSLTSDVEVLAETKADAVDCSDFLVNIDGTTFLSQAYASEQYVYGTMPATISIPYGYYKVTAQSCSEETAVAGFGQVRYYGVSDQVDVLSKETASVTVACSMVNGKASMTFDESFLEDFSEVSVELTLGQRTVSMSSEQANAGTEIFFNLPSEGADLIFKVYGTIAKGTAQEKQLSYTNIDSPMTLLPAKWVKITIKSNHNGVIGPDITVDSDMDSSTSTEVLNPEGGIDTVDGSLGGPSILVDTQIDDATVIDCELNLMS